MSKVYTWIAGMVLLCASIAFVLIGVLCHNDTLLGAGLGLIPGVAAALGIPGLKE